MKGKVTKGKERYGKVTKGKHLSQPQSIQAGNPANNNGKIN